MNLQYGLYTNSLTVEEPNKSFIEVTLQHIKLAERYNYKGTLIPYGKNSFDPWLIALIIAQNTKNLIPLVAVQPFVMPPQTTAKMIQTFEHLCKRQLNINYIVGEENGDQLSHDEKYLRLGEYIEIVNAILSNDNSLTYHGAYYNFSNYDSKLTIAEKTFPKNRLPEIFVSGTSEMCIATSKKYDVKRAMPPSPISLFENYINTPNKFIETGSAILLGIIARNDMNEAWKAARELFPNSRVETIQATVHSKKSQSHWIKTMSELMVQQEVYDDVYWMGAYNRTFSPYLVGDYEQIARYLEKYLKLGIRTFIVAGPYSEKEFEHRNNVFLLLNNYLSVNSI